MRGVPVRVEIGPRDIENGVAMLVRRDTLEKIKCNKDEVVQNLDTLFKDIQLSMYKKAEARRDSMIYEANNYDEFIEIANSKPGFIKANWCGNQACEDKIKDDFNMKSRCLIDHEPITTKCVCCGEDAKYRLYFGRQY